jgi:hypothetical protein
MPVNVRGVTSRVAFSGGQAALPLLIACLSEVLLGAAVSAYGNLLLLP